MTINKQFVQTGAFAVLLMALTACGGSDSSGGEAASTTFTVSLAAVDIHRVSNDDAVSVDTTGIDSGELTLR